ncbi:Uncharacterized protein FKW44_001265 [Caligus rogercresseyi]|uniref:Uncharacterized protein n=1 Tax=Caligus rogercresseyi TaxID=217165 RepID=A0A7T8KIH0_CALRO|nr:Uncharacterized protein FKW44_001265 [Caligus rogercresseyi]
MTLVLRRTLTEILLEVTSSEIHSVCVEILEKQHQSPVVPPQKALGQLLSGYASDEDDDEHRSIGSENEDKHRGSDDNNLESVMCRKKKEFERASEKINSVSEAKEEGFNQREKRWAQGDKELKEGVGMNTHYGSKDPSKTDSALVEEETKSSKPTRKTISSLQREAEFKGEKKDFEGAKE